MTTKTDVNSVTGLAKLYKPAQRGVLSDSEAELIRKELELETRTAIELQNIRDVTVMLYRDMADAATEHDDIMATMDAMSGVAHVIDMEKLKRGLPV